MASIELGAKFNDWDTFDNDQKAVALIAESAESVPMEHTCCIHDADGLTVIIESAHCCIHSHLSRHASLFSLRCCN